ncbi:MAG: GNAT family N-acetyltransferase [Bacteroidota bacterium]|nr:GNAT family N-acetyltransferase [Bacteroidota bacterium]
MARYPSLLFRPGLWTAVLNHIISFGKRRGFLRMELGVSSINTRAIHLYEKAGFQKEGLLKKYIYLKKEDLFLDDVLMAYLYD